MFQNFPLLDTLILDNTNTDEINQNAFSNLQKLKKIHIVNNNLTSFTSNVLNSSVLFWLDLSKNSLVNLTEFNVLSMPSLTILNISDNSLQYLPKSILDKVTSTNSFFLIADNNPWNCSHPKWKQYLTEQLTVALCSNISQVPDSYAESREEESKIIPNVTDSNYTPCSVGVFKTNCPFWMFGALWVGIILGNIKKLKQLVFCPSSLTLEDKATQCGNNYF